MENTTNNAALYSVILIDYENNTNNFWQANAAGATLYAAGATLARALDLPATSDAISERYALPRDLADALKTLLRSCPDWTPEPISETAPHPVFFLDGLTLDDAREAVLGAPTSDEEPQTVQDEDAEQESSEDAEPKTDAQPNEEQDAEPSEEQEKQPSKQEPDCDKDEDLKERYFDAVNEYLDINEVDADDAEAETEALGFRFWALTSLERRAALDLTEEGYADLDESIDRARELDDLTDEAIDFYESIKADGATDEAIENAVDFDALESDEKELVKTLVEEGVDAEDAIRHASRGDYWKMVDASERGDINAALADAYIESMGGIDQLDRDTIERYFDYADFGRDLRFDLDLIETESGDIYLR